MFFVFSDADTDKTGTGRQQHTERGKIDQPFPRGDRHISIWFGLRFFWFMIGIIIIWTIKKGFVLCNFRFYTHNIRINQMKAENKSGG